MSPLKQHHQCVEQEEGDVRAGNGGMGRGSSERER